MKEAKEIIRYDQEVLDEILISGLEKLGLLARENDKIARELCMDFALYKDRPRIQFAHEPHRDNR